MSSNPRLIVGAAVPAKRKMLNAHLVTAGRRVLEAVVEVAAVPVAAGCEDPVDPAGY
jgi:hypothetical protein